MKQKMKNTDSREGTVAKTIESQTAKLPSDIFLWAAVASMGVSLSLKLMGKNNKSIFIGQWAPSFLLLGIYNKIVKVAGHDQTDNTVQDDGNTQDD
jgi:hypothetical protein